MASPRETLSGAPINFQRNNPTPVECRIRFGIASLGYFVPRLPRLVAFRELRESIVFALPLTFAFSLAFSYDRIFFRCFGRFVYSLFESCVRKSENRRERTITASCAMVNSRGVSPRFIDMPNGTEMLMKIIHLRSRFQKMGLKRYIVARRAAGIA